MPRLLIVFCLFRVLVTIVAFLLAGVVLNLVQVFGHIFIFFCYFGSGDLSSWEGSLPASITFIFLRKLCLKLTISRKKIIRLSFVFVLDPILMVPIGVVLICLDRRLMVS